MRQHTGAIDALPHKGIIRRKVIFAPAELSGHEIINAGQLHQLRQRRGVAKHVGQPEHPAAPAKFAFKKALSHQELPRQRFAAAEIAVGLHPHAAFHFPAAFPYPFPDAGVNFRRILFHKIVQCRLAGHKFVFGIAVHQAEYRAEAAHGLVAGLMQIPQPGNVNMRMPNALRHGDGRQLRPEIIVIFLEITPRRLHAFIKGRAVRLAKIQHVQRPRKDFQG